MISFRSILILASIFLFCLRAECASPAFHSHMKIVQKVMLGHGLGWAIGNTKRSYIALKTTDGGRHWKDAGPDGFWPRRTPTELSENDEGEANSGENAGISFLSPNLGAFAAVESDKDGNAVVIKVAYTATAGKKWTLTQIQVPDWTAGINFQFVDSRHSFLLVMSGPSAGLMEKRVYRTADGSQSWQLVSDGVASSGSFYPNGMVFCDAHDGWITASYHGTPDVPLFHTVDGGTTWRLQRLPEPAIYQNGGYGNTNPPQFFGPQKRDGTLIVDYRNNTVNRFESITYVTRNGGRTWRISRRTQTQE